MDINIKYDLNDISAQIKKDITRAVQLEVTEEFKRSATLFIAELTSLLDIKDDRKRDRVKRAITTNLDKWIKKELK